VEDLDVFWTSFLVFAVVFTVVELVRPARKLRYRKALPGDVVAFAVYQLAVIPAATWITINALRDPLYGHVHIPSLVFQVWLPLRIAVFYLAADLGSYWMHRLMHTRHAWRLHRWHHSPTQVYWFSGVRASLLQQLLFNLPTVFALVVVADLPAWIISAMVVEGVARNNWMHMNVSWRSNWLERVFVTPRYHHVHHSSDAALHDGNYGALFSIWDRLFGTYIDPDTATPRTFGTGEKKRDPVLMMIGI
jgi:sterol desaturase/sphingolipid hydroxylase (fatty acid hydroxylase superfamily)